MLSDEEEFQSDEVTIRYTTCLLQTSIPLIKSLEQLLSHPNVLAMKLKPQTTEYIAG